MLFLSLEGEAVQTAVKYIHQTATQPREFTFSSESFSHFPTCGHSKFLLQGQVQASPIHGLQPLQSDDMYHVQSWHAVQKEALPHCWHDPHDTTVEHVPALCRPWTPRRNLKFNCPMTEFETLHPKPASSLADLPCLHAAKGSDQNLGVIPEYSSSHTSHTFIHNS